MYHKELYVFDGNRPVPAVIRNYGPEDFPGLIAVQQESFPPPFPPELWWNTEQLGNHVRLFPEGALCIEVNGEIAGSMTGLLVKNESVQPGHAHTWEEVTDGGISGIMTLMEARCTWRILAFAPRTGSWDWASG